MTDPRLPRGAFARLGILALVALFFVFPQFARADDSTAFDPWLSADSPQRVSVGKLKDVAKVVELDPEQFNFARGLYVAVPPVSRQLPPGDHAILAVAPAAAMVAIIDGDKTCARLLLTPAALEEIMAVGRGDVTHAGDPT
jgi:hypothetical protein